jgi:hypothetical protein
VVLCRPNWTRSLPRQGVLDIHVGWRGVWSQLCLAVGTRSSGTKLELTDSGGRCRFESTTQLLPGLWVLFPWPPVHCCPSLGDLLVSLLIIIPDARCINNDFNFTAWQLWFVSEKWNRERVMAPWFSKPRTEYWWWPPGLINLQGYLSANPLLFRQLGLCLRNSGPDWNVLSLRPIVFVRACMTVTVSFIQALNDWTSKFQLISIEFM